MSQFSFWAKLTADEKDGGWVVTFRDWPEAITQGNSVEDALREAADCLEEALAARLDDRREIPQPSPSVPGEYSVPVPIQTALKAALYLAMQEAKMSQVQLARMLKVDEKEVRRILDPHHQTKLPTLERALAVFGKQIELSLVERRSA